VVKLVLAGAVGFALGLYTAKLYARHEVKTSLDSFLGSVGLGGGVVQTAADSFIPNAIVN
jgi:hypothetical protein